MIPLRAVGATDPHISVGVQLQQTKDPKDARALLAQAAMDGVDPKLLRASWDDWRRMRAEDVHRMECDPDDDYPAVVIRCRCSHAPSVHSEVTGKCWSVVCGCTKFRLKEDE